MFVREDGFSHCLWLTAGGVDASDAHIVNMPSPPWEHDKEVRHLKRIFGTERTIHKYYS